MRSLALAALTLAAALLSGCYASDRLLLDAGQAVTPLATGRQQASGESTETVEITLDPDRWYRVRVAGDKDRSSRVLFTPLAGAAAGERRYAFAYGTRGGFMYGVAEEKEGGVFLDVPFCDLGPAREAAIAHGSKLPAKGAMSPVCTFTTAKDLAAALTDYANRPGPRTGLVRLAAAAAPQSPP